MEGGIILARFLAYLPDSQSTGTGLERLEAVGLQRLRGGAVFQPLDRGPDDGPGILASWPKKDGPRGAFDPLSQEWTPAVKQDDLARGRYWVGFDPADPPRADELAFKAQCPGSPVRLGNGERWLIPSVSAMTLFLGYSPEGDIGRPMTAECKLFMQTAQKLFNKIVGETIGAEDTSEVIKCLCAGLMIGYGLTVEIISALKLLNTSNIRDPFHAAVEGLKLATIEMIEQEFAKLSIPEIESEFAQ